MNSINEGNNSSSSNYQGYNPVGELLSNLKGEEQIIDEYSNFPLNLLPHIKTLINLEIFCVILLLYFYLFKLIIEYLNKKSFKFTNKKIEKIVSFIQSHYTNLSGHKVH